MSSGQSRFAGMVIVAVLVLTCLWSVGTTLSSAGGSERPVPRLTSRCVSNPILQTVSCHPR